MSVVYGIWEWFVHYAAFVLAVSWLVQTVRVWVLKRRCRAYERQQVRVRGYGGGPLGGDDLSDRRGRFSL